MCVWLDLLEERFQVGNLTSSFDHLAEALECCAKHGFQVATPQCLELLIEHVLTDEEIYFCSAVRSTLSSLASRGHIALFEYVRSRAIQARTTNDESWCALEPFLCDAFRRGELRMARHLWTTHKPRISLARMLLLAKPSFASCVKPSVMPVFLQMINELNANDFCQVQAICASSFLAESQRLHREEFRLAPGAHDPKRFFAQILTLAAKHHHSSKPSKHQRYLIAKANRHLRECNHCGAAHFNDCYARVRDMLNGEVIRSELVCKHTVVAIPPPAPPLPQKRKRRTELDLLQRSANLTDSIAPEQYRKRKAEDSSVVNPKQKTVNKVKARRRRI
jgi:hypothetical protein